MLDDTTSRTSTTRSLFGSGTVREGEKGYQFHGLLRDAIDFRRSLGGLTHVVEIDDLVRDLNPLVDYCEAELGEDAVSSAPDQSWTILKDATWTWSTSGAFYFTDEGDATAFALKFL